MSALSSSSIDAARGRLFSPEHTLYRDNVARFLAAEVVPHHFQWEHEGLVPRDLWRQAGAAGLLLPSAPEEYGGGGGDFLHTVIVIEEIARALTSGIGGFTTHSDIVAPYVLNFGTESQKRTTLPGMASGDIVASIAMTEPNAGSDLKAIRTQAIRTAGGYVINGQKTFITNGYHADYVLLAAKTDPAAGPRGISLFWVDTRTPGFKRGRLLEKIGQKAQDTCELFFEDMFVATETRVGDENQGFGYLMKELVRERLMIAVRCAAALEAALALTIDYTRQRQAFGQSLIENQHIRFKLADIKALACATRALVDDSIVRYMHGELDAAGAAITKLWAAEATRAVDELLQLHGGYGYMREYAIARLYTDVRPNRIYGGSSEIMRELIARAL